MWHRSKFLSPAAAVLLLAIPLLINAQPASPPAELLPETLAGVKAMADAAQVAPDGLGAMVADEAAIYQEYAVLSAASRQYGGARVEVFKTKTSFGAFGLFSYNSGAASSSQDVGSAGAWTQGGLIFWKGPYFVRVAGQDRPAGAKPALYGRLAAAVAELIPSDGAASVQPPLLESLPRESAVANSHRYFLGPRSLAAYVERGQDMFTFPGDAEAVMAEYEQPAALKQGARLKLVIAEYHTPQFAADAMAQLDGYVESLPEQERGRIIVKREGNYIVNATGFEDREFAGRLVDSVKYPYTVKWLRNPLWPTNDPFRAQKAAQMLVSTFGLLGVILLSVLLGGSIFGTTIFLKRRRQQREIFSDAGGMLRLELDPVEGTILGLPPKMSED